MAPAGHYCGSGAGALLRIWIDWAETKAPLPLAPWPARVTVLDWGGLRILALPGEIFAQTALDLRRSLDGDPLRGPTMTIGFADGCPGYVPPLAEYPHGGYEVEEAHRYYGMPAAMAPGSAEKLAAAALTGAGSPIRIGLRVASVMQDLAQEGPAAVGLGVGEEFLRRADLDDAALVHEHHPLGDLAGEAHLMRHHHHGHALLGDRGP